MACAKSTLPYTIFVVRPTREGGIVYYALTALVSAAFAMSAQAQTSYSGSAPSQEDAPAPTEPSTIVVVPVPQPSAIVVVEKPAPGVGRPATREEVRAETLAAMKAGNIPRGEQSTPTQFMKPQSIGSEYLWQR